MPSRQITPTRPRGGYLCLCVVLLLAVAGVTAPAAMSAAIEGGNAFSELSQKAQQETTPTVSTPSVASSESTSKSSGVVLLAVIAAVVVLLGIAFVIVRDARKVAPAGDGPLSDGGSPRDAAARLRKRRAKAKAARRQRKRNR